MSTSHNEAPHSHNEAQHAPRASDAPEQEHAHAREGAGPSSCATFHIPPGPLTLDVTTGQIDFKDVNIYVGNTYDEAGSQRTLCHHHVHHHHYHGAGGRGNAGGRGRAAEQLVGQSGGVRDEDWHAAHGRKQHAGYDDKTDEGKKQKVQTSIVSGAATGEERLGDRG